MAMARIERLMSRVGIPSLLMSTKAAAKGGYKKFGDIPGPPSLPVIGNLHLYKFGRVV